MKRILFLDFDGVLNGDATFRRHDLKEPLEPVLMAHVGRLVREMDADVVISSDWRHYFTLDKLRDLLAPHIPADRIIDTTSDLYVRGREIATWLANSPVKYDRVAILDDNDRGRFEMGAVRPWYVKTDAHRGALPAHIDAARRLLSRKGPAGPSETVLAPFVTRRAA